MNPRVITLPLGGHPLAVAAVEGKAPPGSYEPRPASPEAWRARLAAVSADAPARWVEQLAPAIQASGRAAERLTAVADGRGVVVTTGQQPGLFGGPLYTLCKALSALALADELERATGIPVAPVFWAATDDADFKEASGTVIAVPGGAQRLLIDHTEPLGRSMADMPLGDVSAELDALARSAGSTVDPVPLELVKEFYTPEATIGSAYVSLLRALFEPLGIAVLDAAHPATRGAALPVLRGALEKSEVISERLFAMNTAIEDAGYKVQVQDVPGLSLVFMAQSGERKRVPIKSARKHSDSADLGPNVLLRPVVERAILPTAAYVGGAAEIAYFAQIGPIADALGVARPLIVPRWSCTIVEPHVERILESLYLLPEDLRDPHEAEQRIARFRLPKPVLAELATTRAALNERLDALSGAVEREKAPVSAAVTGGLRANLMRRLDRFERRLLAAAKRQHADAMEEIATARGSLYPFGSAQERMLNFVSFLARYGPALQNDMLDEARRHVSGLAGTDRVARSSESNRQALETAT
ncbi:MAG: bacillithiol biosynthesis cysteine-adding enzyme BshC [Gemmatimonadota bacterium]|nr:bacillithiol biosynthesis cysteine-adding enzyme BshC [Gemmatimonadota bacterium]